MWKETEVIRLSVYRPVGKETNSMTAINFYFYNTYSLLSPLVMPPVCSSSNMPFKIERKYHKRVDVKWFRQITLPMTQCYVL